MGNVTVLGGSGAASNPAQGCSGYLVEHEATRIVLDLGPGTLQRLRAETEFRTLDAIIVSHVHVDHVLDLFALRFALRYNPIPPPAPVPLWMPPGGIAFLERAAMAFSHGEDPTTWWSDVFTIREHHPDTPVMVGSLRVSTAPTVHYIPCWAIRVDPVTGDGALGYTADTGPSAPLDGFFGGVSLLIAEASIDDPQIEDRATSGHLTATEAGVLARASRAAALMVTHTYIERDPPALRARAESAFGGTTHLATVGLTIPW